MMKKIHNIDLLSVKMIILCPPLVVMERLSMLQTAMLGKRDAYERVRGEE
jgi:hypothetical protein